MDFSRVCSAVRNLFTAKPVDRQRLDRTFHAFAAVVLDTVIADKDVPNDGRSIALRCALAVRSAERLGKLLITLCTGFGILWVFWFYLTEVGRLPRLQGLGDVFALGMIGLTGPLVSITFCTLLLWSGVSLASSPAAKRHARSGSPHEHLALYLAFFVAAPFCALAFTYLSQQKSTWVLAGALTIDLLGPLAASSFVALMHPPDRPLFRAHFGALITASVMWGLASVLTAIVFAQSLSSGADSSIWQWVNLGVVLLLTAVLSVFPVRFGIVGIVIAYGAALLCAVFFGGALLRDAPFRLWHIGGVVKRVAFTDVGEERKARVRCKMIPRAEKHAYSIYILSDLPGEILYRCDPVHELSDKSVKYITRALDGSKALVEDH